MSQPIFRFFNNTTGYHFFTASEHERDVVIATLPDFRYEGTAFGAATDGRPVYRFLKNDGTHFYTSDEHEKATLIGTDPSYKLEGVAYYATDAGDPLYRFFNVRTGTHLYTIDANERDMIARDMADQFRYEGVAYYTEDDGRGAFPAAGEDGAISGTELADLLVSANGDPSIGQMIFGLGGNDRIEGGAGSDTLEGGPGNDTLGTVGGRNVLGYEQAVLNSSDVISGGAGDDVLYSARNSDLMIGGEGADRYVLMQDQASIASAGGSDTIVGFNYAEGDRIGFGGTTSQSVKDYLAFIAADTEQGALLHYDVQSYHDFLGHIYFNRNFSSQDILLVGIRAEDVSADWFV